MNKIYCFFLSICMVFVLSSCNYSEELANKNEYKIYYIDKEGTGLVSEVYKSELKETDTVKIIEELLAKLETKGKNNKFMNPIEPEIQISDFEIKENQLSLYFTAAYNNKENLDEILSRAAIVKTLCQVEGIELIEFYVEDQSLMLNGNAIGLMSKETFVDNLAPDETEKSKQVTLYFADSSGTCLKEISTDVTYNVTEPLAQLLVEKLIAGPQGTEELKDMELLSTVPEKTKVNSITIRDNICYVDVSKDFLQLLTNVKSDVIVYSIVNTLCELPNVNRVQFTIDGEQHEKYGETGNFNVPYERNLDIIAGMTQENGTGEESIVGIME